MSDGTINASKLKSFIERRARLDAEVKDFADQIKELKKEYKNRGHDMKWLDHCFKMRQMDPQEREELDTMRRIYVEALDMTYVVDPDTASIPNSDEVTSYLDSMEHLTVQKADVDEQLKELNKEIKGEGFEMKHFNYAYKQYQMDANDRYETTLVRTTYEAAAGL